MRIQKLFFNVFICSLFTVTAIAQSNCVNLKTGQKLHYTRQDAPSIMDIENVGLLTPKELVPVQKKFDEDVKAGRRKGKEIKFDGVIGESVSGNNSSLIEIQFITGTYKISSYVICQNDTIYGIKNKTGATPMMDPEGNIEGFIKPGIVKYPRNMKVGDVLPLTVDYTAMLPKKMDFSYKKTVLDYVEKTSIVSSKEVHNIPEIRIEDKAKPYFKEITVNSKATFQITPSTITYRTVESEENVVVGGKTYKALKIATLLDTKVSDVLKDIETDAFEHKLLFAFINNYVNKKTDKTLRQNGNEWFVPELGIVVIAEVLNAEGKPVYKSILNSIE
jgi:hypothetical protein